jgi:hypothetical protein
MPRMFRHALPASLLVSLAVAAPTGLDTQSARNFLGQFVSLP